ncbi:MAG: winged helix-turn-helix domain-containing protein [Candidatus Nitrosocaldaceae archaeon]
MDILELYYLILIEVRDKGLNIKNKPVIPNIRKDIRSYIEEMLYKGLITNKSDKITLTKKGYEFIYSYERFLALKS